jgi:hypothetical protein
VIVAPSLLVDSKVASDASVARLIFGDGIGGVGEEWSRDEVGMEWGRDEME